MLIILKKEKKRMKTVHYRESVLKFLLDGGRTYSYFLLYKSTQPKEKVINKRRHTCTLVIEKGEQTKLNFVTYTFQFW